MKNNIKKIVLVDDDPKSLEAASAAFHEIMPEVEVSTFNSAEEALTELGVEIPFYDIVMAEMKMKKTYYGRMIAFQAWICAAPSVIVSSGENGKVQVGYTARNSVGSKHDVEVWKEIINFIL